MKFIFAVILLASAEAGLIKNDKKCISVRNEHYEQEILKGDVTSPYQLTIDHDTNTLFFSFTARANEMFKTAYLSLKTGEYGLIPGINGGFATAVNSKGHIVYLGGEDGIYTFNYDTKKATNLHITSENIWQMFYKDGLYFTTFPEEKAYFYNGVKVVEVTEVKNHKVMVLAVKDDNLVYSNSSGVFMYSRDKGKTLSLSDAVANGFTIDIEGNLYYSTATGIYYLNDKLKESNEIARIDNVYGIAIEANGNFIYASEDSIIRLKPTKNICFDEQLFSKNAVALNL